MDRFMNDVNMYVGTYNLMTIGHVYCVAIITYALLYGILWFFRNGLRYRMPFMGHDLSTVFLATFSIFAVLTEAVQLLDPKMQYKPFVFWFNCSILLTVLSCIWLVLLGKFIVDVRERIPKND